MNNSEHSETNAVSETQDVRTQERLEYKERFYEVMSEYTDKVYERKDE
jgi:hypothetical protein